MEGICYRRHLYGYHFFIFKGIPSELAPLEDRNQFRLSVTAPEGTSFDYMDNYIDSLSKFMMDSVPEKETNDKYDLHPVWRRWFCKQWFYHSDVGRSKDSGKIPTGYCGYG